MVPQVKAADRREGRVRAARPPGGDRGRCPLPRLRRSKLRRRRRLSRRWRHDCDLKIGRSASQTDANNSPRLPPAWKKTVIAPSPNHIRPALAQHITVYTSVDHDMADVETERTEFSRHTLANHPQPRLGRSEARVLRFSTQACRGARKRIVPRPNGTMWRAASWPRKPAKQPTRRSSN